MHKRQGYKEMRRKAGFTLIETLLVVGILIALLALSFFAVSRYIVGLRLKEMDAKAEIIYVAAQNRLAALRANGCADYYSAEKGDVKSLDMVPSDADRDVVKWDTIFYVNSDARNDSDTYALSAAKEILPQGAVDFDVWNNHWIIEYEPNGGDVYAVFYSEEPLDYTVQELDGLRSWQQRRANGGYVGYYGGDITLDDQILTLKPQISIHNAEKLEVTFLCVSPDGNPLEFYVTIEDHAGEDVEKHTWTLDNSQLKPTPAGNNNYSATICLDDLTDGKRFKDLCQVEGFDLGTDITITLTVVSPESRLVDRKSTSAITNSLFAYDSSEGSDTAVIQYGRHLQNLDQDSHVSEEIKYAVQKRDISFAQDLSDQGGWTSVYGDRLFKPIVNSNLEGYNGQFTSGDESMDTTIYRLTTEPGSSSGLFASLQQGTYQNITLTGTTVHGEGDAGALAGQVAGKVTISNCKVYLDEGKGDLNDKEKTWVSGINAGGLVGVVLSNGELTVNDSFAATVLEGSGNAGGLVGSNQGTLTIDGSYADCYVTGKNAAGLAVGDATVTDAYAAGFLIASNEAAGLVLGDADLTSCYSACVYEGAVTNSDTNPGAIYTTAKSATVNKVVYLQAANATNLGGEAMDYPALCNRQEVIKILGESFAADTGNTHAYNLRDGMGLTSYDFPKLAKLDHYGDWQAKFKPGELVYYEQYSDGTYGFFGASVGTLKNDLYVVGDGYGIVFDDGNLPSYEVRVQPDGGAVETLTTYIDVGGGYYIYPLPVDMVNGQASASYYQKLNVMDETGVNVKSSYYYNPHFAKELTDGTGNNPGAPDVISIRSARQLYLLSENYEIYQNQAKPQFHDKTTFLQEVPIAYESGPAASGIVGYDWSKYYVKTVTVQSPIGSASYPFISQYDGRCNYIYNLNIGSTDQHVGLFGVVGESGQLRNLVLAADFDGTKGEGGEMNYLGGINRAETVYLGTMAGLNKGSITNSAVTGYTTDLNVYGGSIVFMGGFVGSNQGVIDRCSVVSCRVDMNVNHSTTYVGGFAGGNHAQISNCYAIGAYRVEASKGSYTMVAGFAGSNDLGTVTGSYCGTSLVGAGTAQTSAFTPVGGMVDDDCLYLGNGAYYLANTLYAFHSSQEDTEGKTVTGTELKALGENAGAKETLLFPNTTQEDAYPYPAVVRNAKGDLVHYGDWPVEVNLGMLGVFYWEKEEGGSNDGYHLSYIGVDPTRTDGYEEYDSQGQNKHQNKLEGSDLCISHEDGGTVVSYGYGYYWLSNLGAGQVTSTLTAGSNAEANAAFQAQMPQYTFHAITVYGPGMTDPGLVPAEEKLIVDGKEQSVYSNLHVTVSYDGGEYYFTISPLFADAMSYDGYAKGTASRSSGNAVPGTEKNVYQIRSPQQLQFINWNRNTKNATTSVTGSNYTNGTLVESFTYLRYLRYNNGANNKSADTGSGYNYYWEQSHDVEFDHTPFDQRKAGQTYETFTPIGNMYDQSGGEELAQMTMAYFSGVYNGGDYLIKNVEINTTACCAGLFGITMEAKLHNIALYSDKTDGNIIQITDGDMWYCIGGLVGYAGAGSVEVDGKTVKNPASVIENCAVAGYRIEDHRDTNGGWGGANIGGLVGSTNMDITKCSAVTDILIDFTYITGSGYKNIRVGGLVGTARSTISNCYAGGSIKSDVTGEGATSTSVSGYPSIWVAGVSGAIVIRNEGNFTALVGSVDVVTTVKNCYSYVSLPKSGENFIKAVKAIASIGEMANSGYNDYADIQSAEIYNCYCLEELAQDVDDKKPADGNWNGFTIEESRKDDKSENPLRETKIYNDYSPYLSYDQMIGQATLGTGTNAKYFLDVFNDYAREQKAQELMADDSTLTEEAALLLLADYQAYAFVTTTENDSPVPGKYTFPAGDEQLEGRDYPFPAVLTQVDRFNVDAKDGDTVHVHYGAWPKVGLYWSRYETELDLFVHNETTPRDEQVVEIDIYTDGDLSLELTDSDFLYYTEDPDARGNNAVELTAADAAAVVRSVVKDEANSKFIVTLVPQSEGTVYIKPKLGSRSNVIFVKVTAQLKVVADPMEVIQYRLDQTMVHFTLLNKENQPINSDEVQWIYEPPLNPNVAGLQTIKDRPDTVLITGYDLGTTVFRATAVYKEKTGTTLVKVQTLDGGFLGLSDGKQYDQAPVGQGDQEGQPATYGTNGPKLNGYSLFLYGNASLQDVTLKKVTVNGSAVPSKNVQLLEQVTANGYRYRALVISGDYDGTYRVEVTLERYGVEFILDLTDVTMTKQYTVLWQVDGTTVRSDVVEPGGTVTLADAPSRDGEAFDGWYYDGIKLTDAAITVNGNMTIEGRWKTKYTLTFMSDDVVWDTASVIDGETAKLSDLVAQPSNGTQSFAGWKWGEAVYQASDSVTVTGNMTFVAQWSDKITVTVNTNGGVLTGEGVTELEAGKKYTVAVTPGTYVSALAQPTYTETATVKGTVCTWEHDFEKWDKSDTTELTDGMELTASWTKNNVIVVNRKSDPYVVKRSFWTDTGNSFKIDDFSSCGYQWGNSASVYDSTGTKFNEWGNNNRNWEVSGWYGNYSFSLMTGVLSSTTDLFVIFIDD